MKKMKKIFAVILSLAMVLGMSLMTFAEEVPSTPLTPATMIPSITEVNGHPTSSDKVDVKIGGITGNPTVTLYQIASADYGKDGRNGFIQYKWVEGNEIDFQEATSGQITDIANAIVNGKLRVPGNSNAGVLDNDTGIYTANVVAGVYIAILTGANDGSVYNPILLTATYSGTKGDGDVLIGGSINAIDAKYLNGANAVAKKSTPTINKTITGGTVTDSTISGNTLPEGTNTTSNPGPTQNATVSVGDSVEYTITPELPSYPAEARNKKLAINDRTSEGLTFQFDTLEMVLDNDLEVDKSAADAKGIVTFSYDNKVIAYAKAVDTGFDMTFVYENLIYNDGAAVHVPTITYKAIVNDSAVIGTVGNTNTTQLFYTNQPNTDTDWDPSTGNIPTGDDVKEKTDTETVYTYQLAFHKTGEGNDEEGLKDAVFGIYSDPSCKEETLVDIVTTNDKGYAVSSQVSAGKYYIKEITAPAGYSLNDDVFEIEASWTSATTTIKGEVTRRTYTAEVNEAKDDVQVGWLDTDNKFYKLDTAVTYSGRETISVETGKVLVPAYLKSETTTSNTESFTETNNVTGTVTALKNLSTNEEATNIPNTKLTSLPSTGGIGTTIFTIGGCAIMIIAAGLFFASRRKSTNAK